MKHFSRYASWLLGVVCVVALFAATPAGAREEGSAAVYRQESLAHARAVDVAYRHLENFIRDESTAATVWTGAVPPAATRWLDS